MNIENRMAVEGQREQAERYSIPEREYFKDDYDLITFCDITDCKDCPRYGDDCDGEWEDEDDE